MLNPPITIITVIRMMLCRLASIIMFPVLYTCQVK